MKIKTFTILTVAILLNSSWLTCAESLTVNSVQSKPIYVQKDIKPISPYWFPEELLTYDIQQDKNLNIIKASIPLAERVSKDKLKPVNKTQHKDFKVMALSIMNNSVSSNYPQGSYEFDTNVFSYWQYIDYMIYWGGSASEGLIVPPSADVVNAGHTNGVPVLGTIFFPQEEHGGNIEWLNSFLQKKPDGSFPIVDKLIEITKSFGFDGWFINQETQSDLTIEHAELMKQFISELKYKTGDELIIVWYDSMTIDGKMDWQNALTDRNSAFITSANNKNMSDSMFLNFWWNRAIDKANLLESSRDKAKELGINPYDLYAGIDVQANGANTRINWELFDNKGIPYVSLGVYCPSATYYLSSSQLEFEANENRFWVNEQGVPSISEIKRTDFRGISTYAIEKTVVSIPFATNFSMGNGEGFFIDGQKVSDKTWSNRGLSDVAPTYRWLIEQNSSNTLKAQIDYTDAYYGGNSIKLNGKMSAHTPTKITLYSSDITISKKSLARIHAKSNESIKVDLALKYEDNTEKIINTSDSLNSNWQELVYDLDINAKAIRSISLVFTSDKNINSAMINIGSLIITDNDTRGIDPVKNFRVRDSNFYNQGFLASTNIVWNPVMGAKYYEVYIIDESNQRQFYAATVAPALYIEDLLRRGDKTTFEIAAISPYLHRSPYTTTSIKWPNISAPKSNFTVNKTLIAPDESINFSILDLVGVDSVRWYFKGADIETSSQTSQTISYHSEGDYGISLTTINKAGETTKTVNNLIKVLKGVKPVLDNLALDKKATASSFINENEMPKFAVDGDLSTKWCSITATPDITIDLGVDRLISEVLISHAEAGGEDRSMNTRHYEIHLSRDGKTFIKLVDNSANENAETIDAFAPTLTRYIKIVIKQPEQDGNVARIYEIQARGI